MYTYVRIIPNTYLKKFIVDKDGLHCCNAGYHSPLCAASSRPNMRRTLKACAFGYGEAPYLLSLPFSNSPILDLVFVRDGFGIRSVCRLEHVAQCNFTHALFVLKIEQYAPREER